MPKIYTKTGDEGDTKLLFGLTVSKSDPRCEAYGATDQAVSAMGLARALCADDRVKEIVLQTQHEMFIVGAELATDESKYEYLQNNLSIVTLDRRVERADAIAQCVHYSGSLGGVRRSGPGKRPTPHI